MDLNAKHPRVLVIEDDASYYRLLQMYIERAGGDSEVCEDGNLALQKVLSNGYDLVLVDMHLPGLDGIMLSVMLRERGYTKPLIAITALQLENMEEYALKAGLDEYLEKPLTSDKIEALLKKYCTFEVL